MTRMPKIREKILYEIWKEKKFETLLQTIGEEEIRIMDPGEENCEEAGPDFRNSRIRVGNLTYVGDIEIDNDHSDWKGHGHNLDKRYNKVIMHVTLYNKYRTPFVFNKEGRKIPCLCLADFIDVRKIPAITETLSEETEKNKSLKCKNSNTVLEEDFKLEYIKMLGIERYNKKCSRMYARLKELAFIKELGLKEPVIRYDLNETFIQRTYTYDDFQDKELWQQLFYESIFEALGYSNNKNVMQAIAQSANIQFIKNLLDGQRSVSNIEACLFNIAGLIPESNGSFTQEVNSYIDKCREIWAIYGRIYDGKKYDETNWHFLKLRPQNFPTIRLAGGAIFLEALLKNDLISVLLKKVEEIRNYKVLANVLKSLFVIRAEGFWKNHYVFDKEPNGNLNFFVGVSRADDILINVVLPFLSVYTEIFGMTELSRKLLGVFSAFIQESDNNLVKLVSESLYLNDAWKRSVLSQGMLELFRSYCSKNRCMECKIGKEIFN